MQYTYINEFELENRLINGQAIQQWLSHYENNGFRFIHWIEIDATRNGTWALYEHESLDCWDMECYDMGEFLDVRDYDEPQGKRTEFFTLQQLFEYLTKIGAKNDKFVQFCEIQWIYKEFLDKNGPVKYGIKDW